MPDIRDDRLVDEVQHLGANEVERRRQNYLELIRTGSGLIRSREFSIDTPLDFRGQKIVHEGRSITNNDSIVVTDNPPGAIVIRDKGQANPTCLPSPTHELAYRDTEQKVRVILDNCNYTDYIPAGGGTFDVEEGDTPVVTGVSVLDFDGDDFNVGASGTEANISIARNVADGIGGLDGSGFLPIANGGTAAGTALGGFNNLSPLTTLGDTLYRDGSNNVRLAGNITTAKQFLTQTGTGAASAAPVWGAILASDLPAHSSSHESGGTDELDGDVLDIDWNPTNYTPTTSPTEVTSVDELTAHLAGIDAALASTGITVEVGDSGGFSATTMDFTSGQFSVTESPSGEANVSVGTDVALYGGGGPFTTASVVFIGPDRNLDEDPTGFTYNDASNELVVDSRPVNRYAFMVGA